VRKTFDGGKDRKESLKMVYAVISNIGETTGSVRLVNMGDIPQPAKNVHQKKGGSSYYDETYFSNYGEAKANFEYIKTAFGYDPRIQCFEET
jgi:hypothetical protein